MQYMFQILEYIKKGNSIALQNKEDVRNSSWNLIIQ